MKRLLKTILITIPLLLYANNPTPANGEYEELYQPWGNEVSVIVPIDLDFIIDPLELRGHSSVYSETYVIKNESQCDVMFIATGASVTFAYGENIVSEPHPFKVDLSDLEKRIYLELNIGGIATPITGNTADIPPVLLGSSGEENSVCEITVNGMVNPYSEESWKDGDVRISMNYKLDMISLENERPFNAILEEAEPSDEYDVVQDETENNIEIGDQLQ